MGKPQPHWADAGQVGRPQVQLEHKQTIDQKVTAFEDKCHTNLSRISACKCVKKLAVVAFVVAAAGLFHSGGLTGPIAWKAAAVFVAADVAKTKLVCNAGDNLAELQQFMASPEYQKCDPEQKIRLQALEKKLTKTIKDATQSVFAEMRLTPQASDSALWKMAPSYDALMESSNDRLAKKMAKGQATGLLQANKFEAHTTFDAHANQKSFEGYDNKNKWTLLGCCLNSNYWGDYRDQKQREASQ